MNKQFQNRFFHLSRNYINNIAVDGLPVHGFLYKENHSLGEWFKKAYGYK